MNTMVAPSVPVSQMTVRQCQIPVPVVQVKEEPKEVPSPPLGVPSELSVGDFTQAVGAKNKKRVQAYHKVLTKHNKFTASKLLRAAQPRKANGWSAHVKAFREKHPLLALKDALKLASATYKK
jgi:hypothetical protein